MSFDRFLHAMGMSFLEKRFVSQLWLEAGSHE